MYCNFENIREGLFRETSQKFIFVKIKLSQNGKITLPFTKIGISWPRREFQMSQFYMSFNVIHENKFRKIFKVFSIYEASAANTDDFDKNVPLGAVIPRNKPCAP